MRGFTWACSGEAMRHRRLCCCSRRLMRPKSALGTVTKVSSNGLSHFSFEWQTHRSNWLCRMAAHWRYLRIHYPRCVARRGCLSKLLTLQTPSRWAAVTVVIAIKKNNATSKLHPLSHRSKVFLCLVSNGLENILITPESVPCAKWAVRVPMCPLPVCRVARHALEPPNLGSHPLSALVTRSFPTLGALFTTLNLLRYPWATLARLSSRSWGTLAREAFLVENYFAER